MFNNNNKIIKLNFVNDLNYKFPINKNNTKNTNIAYIKKSDIEKLNSIHKNIIIYKYTGNCLELYFNNKLIGTMGNVDTHKSDIWSNFGNFSIDINDIKEINEVKIVSTNTYEYGLLGYPIIITLNNYANKIESFLFFVSFNIQFIIQGILFGISIFLIVLSLYVDTHFKKIDKSYIYFALGILLSSLTIFDHIDKPSVYIPLLAYKKIIIILYYLSTIFISLGIKQRYKNKFLEYLNFIFIALILFFVFIPKSVIELKLIYSKTNFLILLAMINWLYILYQNFKNDKFAKILFLGILYNFIFIAYDLINFAFFIPLNSLYAFGLLIFSLSILGIIILDIIDITTELEFQKNIAKNFYKKSIKDSMTGLYNKEYVFSLLKNNSNPYSLIIIDIDDFKLVNDKHGHLIGDKVIRHVSNCLKSNIRNSDIISRYGGDEFLIVLFNCPIENAKNIANNIKNVIENKNTLKEHNLNISISIGIHSSNNSCNFKEIFDFADKSLYYAKKNGKSQIIVYNELIKN
jgi:diguanylate cyclase (GGDEF)-like protein